MTYSGERGLWGTAHVGGDTPVLVVLSALGVQAEKAMKSKPLNNVASAPGPAPRFLLSFSDGL